MANEKNFDKISEHIMENYTEYESAVKESLEDSRVLPLRQFQDYYEKQIVLVDEGFDYERSNYCPSIDLFTNAFNSLETYPTNLSKAKWKSPKKLWTKQRPICHISKSSSSSLLDITVISDSSLSKEKSKSLLNLTNDFEELNKTPTATETYKDFRTLQEKLNEFYDFSKYGNIEQSYFSKLKWINKFTQHLEKFIPKNNGQEIGSTIVDETRLKQLVTDIQYINAIQDSEIKLHQQSTCYQNYSLQNMLNILTNCLESLNMENLP